MKLAAVWTREIAGLPLVQVSVSADAGDSWSSPQDLTAAGQRAGHTRIRASSDGSTLVVAWHRHNGTVYETQVSTSTNSGNDWSAPRTLSGAGQAGYDPEVISSADGTKLAVVWRNALGEGDRVQVSTSSNSGTDWSTPQFISEAGRDARYLDVVGSADGTKVTTVWHRGDADRDDRVQVSTSTNSGTDWSTPQTLSADGQDGTHAQVSSSIDGSKLTTAWRQTDGTDHWIRVSTSMNSGVDWSTPQTLSDTSQPAYNPQVASSADGSKLTTVWQRSDGSKQRVQTTTSTNSGTDWSTPQTLSPADQDASVPQVTSSTDGTKLITVWDQTNGIPASTSANSGTDWSTPQFVSQTGGEPYGGPQLASSSDGTKHTAVWGAYDGTKLRFRVSSYAQTPEPPNPTPTPTTPPVPGPSPTPSPTPAPVAFVKASAISHASKIRVNVNPNWKSGDYRVIIQKRVGGRWVKVVTLRTTGTNDTVVYSLAKGRYRAVLPAGQNGTDRATSNTIRILQTSTPKTSSITVIATGNGNLQIDVNPNWKKGDYFVKVQRKVRGKWITKRDLTTRGRRDRITVNLPKGKYRAVLPHGQNNTKGATSSMIRVKR